MNMELLMSYITYGLMSLGVLSFLVAVIVQVLKELPKLRDIPTSVVALAVSLILCPLVTIIACQYFKIALVWYYIVGAVIAAFIVYLIATGGWERAAEIWQRTRYRKMNE